MWTEITRPKYDRTGLRYASDLTDAEWRVIEPHMPAPKALGRPRTTDMREVVKRHPVCLALGLAPGDCCRRTFRPVRRCATLFRRVAGRRAVGAHQSPSPDGGPRGRGARGQPIGRRHRQPVGPRPRKAAVHGALTRARRSRAANATSSPTPQACWLPLRSTPPTSRIATAPPSVLASIRHAFPWLRHVFADGAYAGPKLAAALERIGRWTLEIVQRPAGARGFDILPRRWVVERTLAWLNRNRRLAKDFEASVATAQAWLFIASVQLLTRRLVRY